jgi:hypothetical protein
MDMVNLREQDGRRLLPRLTQASGATSACKQTRINFFRKLRHSSRLCSEVDARTRIARHSRRQYGLSLFAFEEALILIVRHVSSI